MKVKDNGELEDDATEKTLLRHSKLKAALELFEDENSGLSISEMMSVFRRALWDNARESAKIVVQYGRKHPISEEEDYIQSQLQEQFKIMDKMWAAEMKANKISGKSSELMSDDFLAPIKNMKSTIGSIEKRLDADLGKNLKNGG